MLLSAPIVLAYYSNFIHSPADFELIMWDVVSKFCVYVLVSFVMTALFGAPARFGADFVGAEDASTHGSLLALPVDAHSFVQSVRFSNFCQIYSIPV